MSTEHSQIMQALGRIEQKIDSHLVEDKEVHHRQDDAISTLYSKANEHDRFRARVKGASAAGGAIFTALLALVGIDWGAP